MNSTLVALVVTLALSTPVLADGGMSNEVNLARAAAKELGMTLKGRLTATLQTQGPTGAVAVCCDEAPAIARAVSDRLGVRVGRTALRVRNPANAADAWEKSGLEKLGAMLSSGVQPADAEVVEVVEGEVRYLKPIVTEPLCLTCHGDAIDAGLMEQIRAAYPTDVATGFKPGDLRGAFTVRVPQGKEMTR